MRQDKMAVRGIDCEQAMPHKWAITVQPRSLSLHAFPPSHSHSPHLTSLHVTSRHVISLSQQQNLTRPLGPQAQSLSPPTHVLPLPPFISLSPILPPIPPSPFPLPLILVSSHTSASLLYLPASRAHRCTARGSSLPFAAPRQRTAGAKEAGRTGGEGGKGGRWRWERDRHTLSEQFVPSSDPTNFEDALDSRMSPASFADMALVDVCLPSEAPQKPWASLSVSWLKQTSTCQWYSLQCCSREKAHSLNEGTEHSHSRS